MNSRLSKILAWGLFALMGGLFVTAFELSSKEHEASLSAVMASFNAAFEQQGEILLGRIDRQEKQLFSAEGLDVDQFIIQPSRVVPVCMAALLESVPEEEAEAAFEQGLALLPDRAALPLFQVAAKRYATTPDGQYRKLSALFNVQELEYDVQVVCRILALLDHNDPPLTDSQKNFFHSLLEEQVPDLEEIRPRLSALWDMAEEIDRKLTRKKGAYREAIGGKLLSVRPDGLAILYVPEVEIDPPFELCENAVGGISREIVPGLFASLPDHHLSAAKNSIQRRYWMGNMILTVMLVLGTGLAIGLFAAARRQRELDNMKTEFIATVSHELRTPLSLIRLHAETLKHGRVPEARIADYHQTILTETERLTCIVNNVLDFSRMERDQLHIQTELTDLTTLTRHLAESFQDRLEQEQFELQLQIAPSVNGEVDPLAYTQVVFNLLDNAIKYSDGEKSIRIELEVSDGCPILRITDRGIGIPDPLKHRVFDEFVRADDNRVTARRGSGIGLNVTKRLIEKMNGTIEVKDNQPKGSVFTVRLKECNETIGG